MSLARPISRGWHFGSASRTARLGRFVLSETQYPGDLRTPWHGHEAPAFCLVLKGCYVQRFRRSEVVYQPAAGLFRPRDVEHTDHISPEGAACFIIEPDAAWLAWAVKSRPYARPGWGSAAVALRARARRIQGP
jgi:hypothetical protein